MSQRTPTRNFTLRGGRLPTPIHHQLLQRSSATTLPSRPTHAPAPPLTIDLSGLQRETIRLREDVTTEVENLRHEVISLDERVDILTNTNALLLDLVNDVHQDLLTLMYGEEPQDDVPPPPQPQSIPALVPPFNRNATQFYVMIRGRAPGIYSNLRWTRRLVCGLRHDDAHYLRQDTYEDARTYYLEALQDGDVKLTGRTPGDEGMYGPATIDNNINV
ncbi:hypothetical protein FA15DRAFT_709841 [Coprinopsis marcescibilis]|uniref:Uncharacterized protein n=1 Tax=Coprinopsis marcescibilis TaxID=230819 RepID=A0A5C3KEK6_COPMA|nr:hypothetical protein FA15DRAFT_709841 [Coprinopsis marcescibilis]